MKKLSLMILFIFLVSGVAQASEYLMENQVIVQGQSLRSSDGHYELKMQHDGNLVIYHDGGAIWATGTNKSDGCKFFFNRCNYYWAQMQGDGNFVVYGSFNGANGGAVNALWATNTNDGSNPPSYLILLNNGKIQLHRGSDPEDDQGLVWQN